MGISNDEFVGLCERATAPMCLADIQSLYAKMRTGCTTWDEGAFANHAMDPRGDLDSKFLGFRNRVPTVWNSVVGTPNPSAEYFVIGRS